MAVKKIKIVPGTGNPVKMQDLQNLWDAVGAISAARSTEPSIISGFVVDGQSVGAGVISFQGQAYYLPHGTLQIGQYIYAQSLQEDQRVYENGTSDYFYTNYIVNVANDASQAGIGILIGRATVENITLWMWNRIYPIAGGDLSGKYPNPTIGTGKVVADRIAAGAVTREKLAASVKTLQIIDVNTQFPSTANSTIIVPYPGASGLPLTNVILVFKGPDEFDIFIQEAVTLTIRTGQASRFVFPVNLVGREISLIIAPLSNSFEIRHAAPYIPQDLANCFLESLTVVI